MGHMDYGISTSDEQQDSWDIATEQVHWPLGGVLTSEYAPALRVLGLLDPRKDKQHLGRGGFGVAYRAKLRGRDSVIKLTRDPLECIASWALRDRETEHVVPIHSVWSLPKMQRHDHWASWWVVHRDYLQKLTAKDEELLELLFDLWTDDDVDLSIPRALPAGRSMREKWRLYLREESDCNAGEIQRALILLDQISHGVREMGAVGIDWTDILPDNLLRDSKGHIRISDVGFGRAKRVIECVPPELTVQLAREYVSRP